MTTVNPVTKVGGVQTIPTRRGRQAYLIEVIDDNYNQLATCEVVARSANQALRRYVRGQRYTTPQRLVTVDAFSPHETNDPRFDHASYRGYLGTNP